MLSIDILIATHRPEGIERVAEMLPDPIAATRYVISWQNHEDFPLPEELKRADVEVHRFDSPGLSANRNNALRHCHADIVLIADDDVIINTGALEELRKAYAENPEMDLATLHADFPGKSCTYPHKPTRLSIPLPKGYYVSSIEISFRRKPMEGYCFNPMFGLGTEKLSAGEDELFLLTAIRRGLDCRYLPISICSHPNLSTGLKAQLTPGEMRAMGAVIALTTPASAILRIPLKAFRISHAGQNGFLRALIRLVHGAWIGYRIKLHHPELFW